MKLTANSNVALRVGNVGDWTEFGMDAVGVGSWSFSDTFRTRPIPSVRGLLAIQLMQVRDVNCGFTLDDNPTTAPLLWLASGSVFGVRIRPDGILASGAQEVVLAGPARIGLSNVEAGVRSYRFDLTATSVSYGLVP